MKTKSSLKKNDSTSRRLYERFRDFVAEREMISPGDRVLAAVSGGADSVCMLLLLNELRGEVPFELLSCYIEHGIRGSESVDDGVFVESLSRMLGIDCKIISVDVMGRVRQTGESVEEAARKLRYDALNTIDHSKLAVAHHLEDQAETVLFRMARGTGPKGLCGMAAVNGNIIRPVLEFSREEILKYLDENGQTYRVDVTNDDTSYDRNRLRHNVLPELEKINAEAFSHILSLSDQMSGLMKYIDEKAGKYIDEHYNGEFLLTEDLRQEPKAFSVEVLRKYIADATDRQKDITAGHYDSAYELIAADTGSGIDLPAGWRLEKTYGGLVIKKRGEQSLGADKISLEKRVLNYDNSMKIPVSTYTKWVDYDKITGDVVLRNRQAKDYVVLDDEGHRKSLKDWMIDKKIPRDKRDNIWLVAAGSEVLWVVGYRIGARCKVTDKTIRVMELKAIMEDEHEG